MPVNAKRVAVVIPHPNTDLTVSQEFSIQTCLAVLKGYPVFYLTKKSVSVEPLASYLDRVQVLYVDDERMATIESYSKFLMSPEFYRLFAQFEYILVHQLDAVVFEDRLLEWCDKGYEYVGPPMFQGEEPRPSLWQSGNGGFSLRKTSAFLELLASRRVFPKFEKYRGLRAEIGLFFLMALRAMLQFPTSWIAGNFPGFFRWFFITTSKSVHEDAYFAFFAVFFIEKWVMPSPEESADFGFDRCPKTAYAINGGRIPFGCHAWEKYDKAFIEQLLEKKGLFAGQRTSTEKGIG